MTTFQRPFGFLKQLLSKFKNQDNEDMQPVWNWLSKKNGKIAYSNTKKFDEEWERGGVTDLIKLLKQAEKLKEIPAPDVEKKGNELRCKIESDDPHIIALAIVADIKVLVSSDQALHQDFKNRNLVGGKVYQNKKHARLLKKDTCP